MIKTIKNLDELLRLKKEPFILNNSEGGVIEGCMYMLNPDDNKLYVYTHLMIDFDSKESYDIVANYLDWYGYSDDLPSSLPVDKYKGWFVLNNDRVGIIDEHFVEYVELHGESNLPVSYSDDIRALATPYTIFKEYVEVYNDIPTFY